MHKRWPLHPVPDEYESLFYWIERLAKAYEVTLHTFCKHVLGLPRSQLILLHNNPPEDVLVKLEAGTGIPIEQLRDMTMANVWRRLIHQLEIAYEQDPDAFKPFLKNSTVNLE